MVVKNGGLQMYEIAIEGNPFEKGFSLKLLS